MIITMMTTILKINKNSNTIDMNKYHDFVGVCKPDFLPISCSLPDHISPQNGMLG